MERRGVLLEFEENGSPEAIGLQCRRRRLGPQRPEQDDHAKRSQSTEDCWPNRLTLYTSAREEGFPTSVRFPNDFSFQPPLSATMPESKVVLVTGASSGFGKETTTLLSQHGFQVFGTSRKPSAKEAGAAVEMLQLDI